MKIAELFLKDIARPINGVIKVGQQDATNVQQELEEYVVTRELDKHFHTFFDRFSDGLERPNGDVGVWISGFFGSGKSHFLKIVSYLLENRIAGGQRAVEYFDDGLKLDDPMLLGNLKKTANASIDVILFNIDSKADANAKQDKDSIVKVFQKVFDEHLGYFGTLPGLANFERQLDARGSFVGFKTAFERIAGQPWVGVRDGWAFERDSIIQSLQDGAGMTESAAVAAFESCDKDPVLSVEGFAKTVNAYLETKPKAHRIAFMVDEVGQYIGEDSRLMLNLQTVVEDLAVLTGGRAWVVVTSQEAMDQITKNMRGNDFSKIQGRFKHRINLSSTNTDEVIKLRLLRKTDAAHSALEALYAAKSAVLKNQIAFTDGAELPGYRSEADFVGAYPFVPYQFNLLQKVFTQIRIMGAAGKHLAEGERSLLDAFQAAARFVADRPLGALAPFNAFYEAIQNFVDGGIKRVIDQAGQNAQLEAFDVELLKTMFMVKYVKELPASLENLTTLHVSEIEEDKLALRERVAASLARLEKQTLIQRQGDRYEFLTNEEQDVGREIKGTNVDPGEVAAELQKLAWDGVIRERKFKFSNRHTYEFNRKLDDQLFGKQVSDLGVHIVTPYASRYRELQSNQACLLETGNGLEVLVRLPENNGIIAEAIEYVQTDKYLRRKSGTNLTATARTILQGRGEENSRRAERLEHAVEQAIAQADVFANGAQVEVKTREARSVVQEGLRSLVTNTYNKLDLIRSAFDTDEQIARALTADSSLVALDGSHANAGAHAEIAAWLEDQARRQQRVTMRALIDHFGSRPFGWMELDTLGAMAELINAGRVELRLAQGAVNPAERGLVAKIRSKAGLEEYTVRLSETVDSGDLVAARRLARDLLDEISPPTETPKLLAVYRLKLTEKRERLEGWAKLASERAYPFREDLEASAKRLGDLLKADTPAPFFAGVKANEAALEALIDAEGKWKAFFEKQVKLFDSAREDLKVLEPDLHHVADAALIERVNQARAILGLPDPTSRIPNLPGLLEPLKKHVAGLLESRKAEFLARAGTLRSGIDDVAAKLDAAEVSRSLEPFARALDGLRNASSMDAAIARNAELEDALGKSRSAVIARINHAVQDANSNGNTVRDGVLVRPIVSVRAKDLIGGVIETPEQLEAFMLALRERLTRELETHNISIE